MPERPDDLEAEVPLPAAPPLDVPRVYSNFVAARAGVWDLTLERRVELVEELIQWAADPTAHDWDRVERDDPYEPDGHTP